MNDAPTGAPNRVCNKGEFRLVRGKVGFPFFDELILDCLQRTERAMSQEHTFLAIELALEAQGNALRVGP